MAAALITPVLTQGIGELDLRDIGVYRAQGGYEQLRRALTELSPKDVSDICSGSNLRGRGGAGFPTGPQVGVFAEQRAPALHGLQLRRGRARHVQGPHAARGDAAPDHRGDPDRCVRDRMRARVHLHSRRVQARIRDHARRRGTGPCGRLHRREPVRHEDDARVHDPSRRRRVHLRRGNRAAELARREARRAAAEAAASRR